MELNTIITSAVTILVGLFVFVIYRIEKTDKDKSAANIVLEETRTIEKNVDKLKESNDLISIMPSAFSTSGWFEYRYLLIKFLDFDEILQIGIFFERVEELKEMLSQWRVLYYDGLKAKNTKMQEKLIDLAENTQNREDYEVQKKKITEIMHNDSYWFEPFIFKETIASRLKLLTSISTTTVGDKLKKIGKKKWLTIRA